MGGQQDVSDSFWFCFGPLGLSPFFGIIFPVLLSVVIEAFSGQLTLLVLYSCSLAIKCHLRMMDISIFCRCCLTIKLRSTVQWFRCFIYT